MSGDGKPEEVDLKDLSPEDQKRIRECMQTVSIVGKQKESQKRRKRKGGAMHKPGPHWYGLEAYFDPKLIESTPIENSGFMMGMLEDFVVIEYKPTMSMEALNQISQQLNDMGFKVMMIPAGIRFMRLRAVTDEEERKMNGIMEAQHANEEDARKTLDS